MSSTANTPHGVGIRASSMTRVSGSKLGRQEHQQQRDKRPAQPDAHRDDLVFDQQREHQVQLVDCKRGAEDKQPVQRVIVIGRGAEEAKQEAHPQQHGGLDDGERQQVQRPKSKLGV